MAMRPRLQRDAAPPHFAELFPECILRTGYTPAMSDVPLRVQLAKVALTVPYIDAYRNGGLPAPCVCVLWLIRRFAMLFHGRFPFLHLECVHWELNSIPQEPAFSSHLCGDCSLIFSAKSPPLRVSAV